MRGIPKQRFQRLTAQIRDNLQKELSKILSGTRGKVCLFHLGRNTPGDITAAMGGDDRADELL